VQQKRCIRAGREEVLLPHDEEKAKQQYTPEANYVLLGVQAKHSSFQLVFKCKCSTRKHAKRIAMQTAQRRTAPVACLTAYAGQGQQACEAALCLCLTKLQQSACELLRK
jgi:hypothetical protein